MKFLAEFIMKGRIQAVMVASFMALLALRFAPVCIISSATIALVTLRSGGRAGLLVILLASFASSILGLLLFDDFLFILAYVLTLWSPIWVIALILREGRSLTIAVEITTIIGVLGIIAFYLWYPDPVVFWHDLMEQMLAPLREMINANGDELQQFVTRLAKVMTGVMALGMILSLLFGLFMARWWQALLYNPGGFREEYFSLKAHFLFSLFVLCIIVAAFFLPENNSAKLISVNLLIVFFVMYSIIGTAALHASFAAMKNSRVMVAFLYVTLLLIPHVAIAIAIFGLGDSWFNLRQKISKNTGI